MDRSHSLSLEVRTCFWIHRVVSVDDWLAWTYRLNLCVLVGTMNIISNLGHKYGSLSRFWLGSKLLVYVSLPEHMETLLTSEVQDKGDVYDNIADLMGGHGLLNLNGNNFLCCWWLRTRVDFLVYNSVVTKFRFTGNSWKIHRKFVNNTQHYSIINSFSSIFDEKIKMLIEKVKESDGKTVDIYTPIEAATADIVCSNHSQPIFFKTKSATLSEFIVSLCRHNIRC